MAVRFQFFSRSADRKPGKGAGEYNHSCEDYSALAEIPDWRKELSNFSDSCVVDYDGLSFRTIEHAFHYAKCSKADKGAAFAFSMESGTGLSRGSGADARAKRKLVVLGQADLDAWAVEKRGFLKLMWCQKVDRSIPFRDVLMKTKGAQLWHVAGRGMPCERWSDLEAIRDSL